MIVLLEVQLLDGVLDRLGHSESPGDRAVLGLADVLAEIVLLQTALTRCTITRIHGRHQVTQVGVVVHRDGGRHVVLIPECRCLVATTSSNSLGSL